jgi:hypothetical protein
MALDKVDTSTREQILQLELDPQRPLLLCDVDEVVVHFLRGLENWLDRNGLWLDPPASPSMAISATSPATSPWRKTRSGLR